MFVLFSSNYMFLTRTNIFLCVFYNFLVTTVQEIFWQILFHNEFICSYKILET